ncbi:putative transcriptional regulator [Azospirillum agricola]|uniref:helix-turn-helix domain-containing protein n=1 Tax=Azospirillum agricola TaxID=1720247 RepID=UPI001AEA261E|nr:helix-turn-helix transcriptional regulator [Azospirillum agricola]MBP2233389.1 putative transcriptional regulator [Azospirillum agricola]
MITPRQIRAARALLGWTQETLADTALVALTALKRLESDRLEVRDTTRDAVRKALEDHGVIFLSSARGLGVMLVDQPDDVPVVQPETAGQRAIRG